MKLKTIYNAGIPHLICMLIMAAIAIHEVNVYRAVYAAQQGAK